MINIHLGVLFGRIKFWDAVLILMYAMQLVFVELWRWWLSSTKVWTFQFYKDYSDSAWWIFKLGSDQFLLLWGAIMLMLPVGNKRVRSVVVSLNVTFWLLSFICWCLFFNQGRPFFWCVFMPLGVIEVLLWRRHFKKAGIRLI